MVEIPRIITLDPTGAVGRALRSALVLLDVSCTHVDVPTAAQAMTELNNGSGLLIAAYALDYDTGPVIASAVCAARPEVSVIIISNEDDPHDEAEAPESDAPYVVFRRPFQPDVFIRAIEAAMDGRSVRDAVRRPVITGGVTPAEAASPVPAIDVKAATAVLERLSVDVGARAVLLGTRNAELVVESGLTGSLNKQQLIDSLAPSLNTGRGVKDVLGGQLSSLQFFDGEEYDVFVLLAGLHHFICIVYDGQGGQRNFGAVNRFGRRATEDVIAIIGAGAFIWEPARTSAEPAIRRTMHVKPIKLDEQLEIPLAKAEIIDTTPSLDIAEEVPQLAPIEDLDLDALFGDMPMSEANDDSGLFDLDSLSDLTQPSQGKGKLSWDQAKEIGLIP